MSTILSNEAPPSAPAGPDELHLNDQAQNAVDATNNEQETSPLMQKGSTMSSQKSSAESDDTLANKAIKFFSTATPGTLGAVAVAFATLTYLILGQLGLLIIGAFVGAGGFIAFEARHPEVARVVQGESGLDILERLGLELKKAGITKGDDDELATLKSFDEFQPQTREALGSLVDATIRDYVKWWYSPIIPSDHSFPLAVRKTLTSYLLAISNRLYRKRPADMFLDLLTNSSSMVIVFMSELAAAFTDLPPDSKLSATDAVYNYLAANPESRLANLLNQRQQSVKFRMVAEDLLDFLDRNSYNCDPARVFLREIIANTVLENTLQTWSKAEWINGWIVYLLEAGEPDISQAIDVGMQSGRDAGQNILVDMDGNVGNVGIAKPTRIGTDAEKSRRKETMSHKKKLSKAEEEMDDAMEEMKRMNAMIVQEEARRKRQSMSLDPKQRPQASDASSSDAGSHKPIMTPDESSPSSLPSGERQSLRASTDDVSTKSEIIPTPLTPQSTVEASSRSPSPAAAPGQHFTNFDQIVPPSSDHADDDAPKKAPLTLHNATFTLHDDSTSDKNRIRSKPVWDYLIQVEPASAGYSGWMIVRRYSDFETLHEILKRIATISGATAFTELHKDLPNWRMHTRESLRGELERYLRDACWYMSLAESEGMKRFLEKSQGHTHTNSKSFGWETMGKNMLDVLTTAPKGAMEGGKTIVGGVSGVLGQIPGLSRRSTTSIDLTPNRAPIATPPRMESMPRMESLKSPVRSERGSLDSQRSSIISTQPGRIAPMERRPSYQSQGESEGDMSRTGRLERMESAPGSARPSREHSRAPSLAPLRSPSLPNLDYAKFPTPLDDMAYEQESPMYGGKYPTSSEDNLAAQMNAPSQTQTPVSAGPGNGGKKWPLKPTKQYAQLSEQETRVAVELLFAVINEMYTLSSAWNIRRTLLAAAKSFLLRPGNPSLMTVQTLMQSSVLDANTSDAGIAAHLRKIRENTMPTEQERAAWPAELSDEEKKKLAAKARKLLIQSGVPAALMGVMGQSATGEALGRLFDCLQIEEVARGLLFGLLLQMVRVITH